MNKSITLQGISTRITDVCNGAPAPGIPVRLERHREGKWHPVEIAITDDRGRAYLLETDDDEALEKGDYRLTFEVAAYFKARDIRTIFPFVQITFSVTQIKHHHFPLLLGPFGYSMHAET